MNFNYPAEKEDELQADPEKYLNKKVLD